MLATLLALSAAPQTAKPDAALARAQEGFGLRLLRAAAPPMQNAVLSPNCVLYCLSGLLPGSTGESRAKLALVMGTTSAERLRPVFTAGDPGATLEVAAGAWLDDQLAPSAPYLASVKQQLGYEVTSLDLQSRTAAGRINDWVRQATKGRIPSILDAIPSGTAMVLTSALYYRGAWAETMSPLSEPLQFKSPSSTVRARAMTTDGYLPRFESDVVRAVQIPLKGSCAAEIYVPVAGRTVEEAADWLMSNQISFRDAGPGTRLVVPYWRSEYHGSLVEPLARIGLAPIFQPRNEFEALAPGLFVTFVVHRTWVDFNERGIEAAAATAVGGGFGGGSSKPRDPEPFIVDRPFLFVLRHKATGAALFMGFVYQPTSA